MLLLLLLMLLLLKKRYSEFWQHIGWIIIRPDLTVNIFFFRKKFHCQTIFANEKRPKMSFSFSKEKFGLETKKRSWKKFCVFWWKLKVLKLSIIKGNGRFYQHFKVPYTFAQKIAYNYNLCCMTFARPAVFNKRTICHSHMFVDIIKIEK